MITDDLLSKDRMDALASFLAPFGPRRPLGELVYRVNQLFHACEAADYDRRHSEIHEQLPGVWRQLIGVAATSPPAEGWTILDFGCGTGFASLQLLQALPATSIRRLVCFDPSPEMLARCRRKVAPQFACAEFASDHAELWGAGSRQFNLLATNSVLHHLPDPFATLRELEPQLSPGCIWLAGHEPSRRYYANAACRQALSAYRRSQKWRRRLSARHWLRRLRSWLGGRKSPAAETARRCVATGLFAAPPSPGVIDRLVDFHVPHGVPRGADAASCGGFDVESLHQGLGEAWALEWFHSYSFLGRYYEASLPPYWAGVARRLADDYPLDGATFCTAWRFEPARSPHGPDTQDTPRQREDAGHASPGNLTVWGVGRR